MLHLKKRSCPNCRSECALNEHEFKCRACGWVFIEMIKRMGEKETDEREHIRRTGNGVDRLNG